MNGNQEGLHKQIDRILNEVLVTLSMLVGLDQRIGIKALYRDDAFNNMISDYYKAGIDAHGATDNADLMLLLIKAADEFILFSQNLFPRDKSRMRTVLRREFGKTFSVLYKNTEVLIRLARNLDLSNQAIEPIDLPEQQAAPIYTKVENDRVILQPGRSLHPFLRTEAVNETRRYLRNELAEIDKALAASNVERKYIDAFGRLHDLLNFNDDAGAISFGLHVRTVSLLTKKIEDELSEILNIQITATLTHAAFFASQYKDWMEFLQNAHAYPTRHAVEANISPALESIAELLEKSPESIDERIPHTIKLITTLLSGSAEDRKNAVFAGIRSVENFCISTIRYCYDQAKALLQDAGATARPRLVKIGAFAIVTVALGVIGHFMPVIVNTAELTWIVENLPNIERLSKILKP